MNKSTFIRKIGDRFDELLLTIEAKNNDYTGGNDDPFFCFKSGEYYKTHTVEIDLWSKMTDKVSRIAGYVRMIAYAVSTESVIDSLLDLAAYCIIMAVYITDKETKCES